MRLPTSLQNARGLPPSPDPARRLMPEALESRRLFAAYSLVDLGTLGGSQSYAYDVNTGNVVVGYSKTATGSDRAFRFADADNDGVADPGEMTALSPLAGHSHSYAYGVNDAGQVVGTSRTAPLGQDGVERAVRWNAGAVIATDLGLGDGSNAYDINSGGAIVGGSTTGIGLNVKYLPFVRSAAGAVTHFSLPEPFNEYGEAHGINDSGVVTGYSGSWAGDSAFVRSAGGTLTAVGHAGATQPYSYGWDVSDTGLVAGEGYTGSNDYRAFRHGGGTTTDLGTLPGYGSSGGYGVNDAGVVVGWAEPAGGPAAGPNHAFLYRGGRTHDLNTLIPAGSGWTLTEARAINDNDNGYIVGTGVNAAGATRAFLLRPSTTATVVGRHVFYNRSAYDGNDAAPGAADDGAVDPAKSALLPGGTASAANVTQYSRGLNGVMVDVTGLPPGAATGLLGPEDVSVRTTSPAAPNTWSAGPAPSSVTVRPGAGVGGSDRVTLVWPDGALTNRWVEVTLRANTDTRLPAADVFRFANLVADADGSRAVNLADFGALRADFNKSGLSIANGRSDFNRDGTVNLADFGLLRGNFNKSLPSTPPSAMSLLSADEEEDE